MTTPCSLAWPNNVFSNQEATKSYPSPSHSTFSCTTLYSLLLPHTVRATLLYHSRPRTVKDSKEAILLYAFLEKGHTSTRSSRQNRLTSSPLNTNTYVKRTANRGMRFSLFKFKDILWSCDTLQVVDTDSEQACKVNSGQLFRPGRRLDFTDSKLCRLQAQSFYNLYKLIYSRLWAALQQLMGWWLAEICSAELPGHRADNLWRFIPVPNSCIPVPFRIQKRQAQASDGNWSLLFAPGEGVTPVYRERKSGIWLHPAVGGF